MGLMIRGSVKHQSLMPSDRLEPHLFVMSCLIFLAISAFMIWKRPDGDQLALLLGGRLLTSPQTDAERRLQNVVEEMAIASGVPLPRLYILEREVGINAFAAGTDPRSIVIGVTRGSIELLSREELQGVIGHEFSHILNEDMQLNTRLAAAVSTFLLFVQMGREVGRRKSSYGKRHSADALGGVLMLIGSVGYALGRLLQSFISQQREYLADASAVQFTRNPEGLARALAKISLGTGSRLHSNHAEYAHIFFAEGFSEKMSSLLSSHPPLRERIKKIVPNQPLEMFISRVQHEMTLNPVIQKAVDKKVEKTLHKAALLNSIGAPTAENLALSQMVVNQLAPVKNLMLDPQIARGTLALLTFRSQQQYAEAKALLREEFPTESVFDQIANFVDKHDAQERVGLFQYAIASLRNLSLRDKKDLLEKMEMVFHHDQHWTFLEVLLYLNAKLLLLPAPPRVHAGKVSAETILQKIATQETPSLEEMEHFIFQHRSLSLIQKKSLIDKITEPFLSAHLYEEFRLLCLSLAIPVPPFAPTNKALG
ncbi:MAG: M48 family metallopeptidase [Bdellovibrio sp.]